MDGAVIGVVDDDRAVRRGLARMLTACGYEVHAYESAAAFLEQAHADMVDCLLVDVRMPEMTGFDFREQLIRRGHRVPVIFISGDNDTLVGASGSGDDLVRVLVKPFDEDALLTAISDLLSKTPRHRGPSANA